MGLAFKKIFYELQIVIIVFVKLNLLHRNKIKKFLLQIFWAGKNCFPEIGTEIYFFGTDQAAGTISPAQSSGTIEVLKKSEI